MLASSLVASSRVCSLASSRVSWCTVPSVFKLASPGRSQLASCELSNLVGASDAQPYWVDRCAQLLTCSNAGSYQKQSVSYIGHCRINVCCGLACCADSTTAAMADKIKVANPVVDLDGDEMTRYGMS
jgi:hypothetical protein